jgi:hypothetical protein
MEGRGLACQTHSAGRPVGRPYHPFAPFCAFAVQLLRLPFFNAFVLITHLYTVAECDIRLYNE